MEITKEVWYNLGLSQEEVVGLCDALTFAEKSRKLSAATRAICTKIHGQVTASFPCFRKASS